LGLTGQQLKKEPCFCELLKLAACEKTCQVLEVLHSGEALRLDEAPAVKGSEKLRILLKVVPLFESADRDNPPIGAFLTVLDTTGEVLLSAKYHKLIQVNADKDTKIAHLEEQVANLQSNLAARRARGGGQSAA